MTSAPVLCHFDPTKEITLETDASNLVSAGIPSQPDDEGILHPVAFYSKKHSPAECGYPIYDKELLAIVLAFKHWRPLLEGATHPLQVITDHRNLVYFTRKRLLNYRQTEWSEFLSRFTFKINYQPGTLNGKADALTRQQDESEEENEERQAHRMQTVLKSQNLGLLADIQPTNGCSHFDILLSKAYEADPFPSEIIASLLNGQCTCNKISLNRCEIQDQCWYYCESLFVPDYPEIRLYLLQQHHDVLNAGHCCLAKTFELLAREYIWFGMRKDVRRYIRNCHTCQRSRTPRRRRSGILRPFPIPYRPWPSISMDFVTGLPWSNGNDAIWVVVDRLTKTRHFIPCRTTTNATDLANLFLHHVWKHHGLPLDIISDRGPQFANDFWRQLCSWLGISPHLSTALHPETDGQTERANQTMEQYLCAFVSHQQDDWSDWLRMAEFAANNQQSETTQTTTFFTFTGHHPRCSLDLSPLTRLPENVEALETATKLNEIHELVHAEIRYAQAKQQEDADKA